MSYHYSVKLWNTIKKEAFEVEYNYDYWKTLYWSGDSMLERGGYTLWEPDSRPHQHRHLWIDFTKNWQSYLWGSLLLQHTFLLCTCMMHSAVRFRLRASPGKRGECLWVDKWGYLDSSGDQTHWATQKWETDGALSDSMMSGFYTQTERTGHGSNRTKH